jgi:hypothetical protein
VATNRAKRKVLLSFLLALLLNFVNSFCIDAHDLVVISSCMSFFLEFIYCTLMLCLEAY